MAAATVIPARPRIVSLLPAGTDMLAALGALDDLVGVTHECDWPASIADRPRVTESGIHLGGAAQSAAHIDAQVHELSAAGLPMFTLLEERITALQPTLFLTQALCEVCAVSETDVRALAARLRPPPAVVTLSGTTLEGVMTDIIHVADGLGMRETGEQIVHALRNRIARVQATIEVASATPRRTAVIEWTDPPYAAGHWVPEMVELAGGMDVLAQAGSHSSSLRVSDIRAAKPEIIVFAPCGYSLSRAVEEATQTLARDEWRWGAACEIWAIDGNSLTSRPGPRLADGVEVFAGILHPDLFPPPAVDYAARI